MTKVDFFRSDYWTAWKTCGCWNIGMQILKK